MELLKCIPCISISGVHVSEPIACGAGTYCVTVTLIDEQGYEKYLEKVESEGFTEESKVATDNGIVRVSVYREADWILTVAYFVKLNKSYVSISPNLLCNDWNGEALFRELPVLKGDSVMSNDIIDYGAGNYVVTDPDTTKNDYDAYLLRLTEAGFEKYVDNGSGLNHNVFSATYTKQNLVVTITHVSKLKKTYISACLNLPLSEHLIDKDEYVTDNQKGAKTTLHMMELWHAFGNSFVIQLKNGHFIVSDGGFHTETGYLIDYLESLVPRGEKPVVEAWFISHAHIDHYGVFRPFLENSEYGNRVYVEGIYYNEPCNKVVALDLTVRDDITFIHRVTKCMRTTKGNSPEIYRPQTGQRYYFNDITVDIVMAQEQLPFEQYSGDFNDSSTWCMFTIEGQKCLLGGDGDKGGTQFIMKAYEQEYLDFDVFSVLHHGHGTRDDFTRYCKFKTVLFTKRGKPPAYKLESNTYLKEVSEEWLVWDDGTKVLTFPYTVGEAKCLSQFDWIYHKNQERPSYS